MEFGERARPFTAKKGPLFDENAFCAGDSQTVICNRVPRILGQRAENGVFRVRNSLKSAFQITIDSPQNIRKP